MDRCTARNCNGQVLIIVAIGLLVLIIAVGVAIDAGRGYGVKAKLYAAIDAAAIAAGRAVSEGTEPAKDAAIKFFYGNYPDGYLGSTPLLRREDIVVDQDPATGDTTINVSASANMPTILMRIIGQDAVNVVASAQVSRRAVDLALVVDNTTSLMDCTWGGPGPGDATGAVVARSIDFVANFQEEFDRLALVKYAFGGEVPVPFTTDRGFDKDLVNTEINAFDFGSCSGTTHYTNAAEGFWNARNQHTIMEDLDIASSLKVIVFFTDGAPNTFASTFEFDNDPDQAGSIRSASGSSGTPRGLYKHYLVPPDTVDSHWYGSDIADDLTALPQYYNPCDDAALDGEGNCADPHTDNFGSPPPCGCPTQEEFLVLNPTHPRRPVTQYSQSPWWGRDNRLYTRVNRVSRNLLEDMAKKAREEGIYVYTLGLGVRLTEETGPDNERGEDVLLRMANDPGADTYNPDHEEETEGIYCHAVDADALGPCYEEILRAIIRLTM